MGLPLPGDVRREVGSWIETWRRGFPVLKAVREDALHITLFFFGERSKKDVESIIKVLDDVRSSPIEASLGDISCFPDRRNPRVFFIELADGREQTNSLYLQIMSVLAALEYRPDERPFLPHITFARARRPVRVDPLPDYEVIKGKAFAFDRLVLFESVLHPTGAKYTALETVKLS